MIRLAAKVAGLVAGVALAALLPVAMANAQMAVPAAAPERQA